MSIIFLFVLLLISSATCWWDGGHLIVAEIGMNDLKKQIPEAGDFFESLTKVMYPMTHGKVQSFMESAVWPDLTKQYKNTIMDLWHYTNIAVNDTTTKMPYVDPKKEVASSIALIVSLIYNVYYR